MNTFFLLSIVIRHKVATNHNKTRNENEEKDITLRQKQGKIMAHRYITAQPFNKKENLEIELRNLFEKENLKDFLEQELRNLDFVFLFLKTFEKNKNNNKKFWLSFFFLINGIHTSRFALKRRKKLESICQYILPYLRSPPGPCTLQYKYRTRIPYLIFDIFYLTY
jgi:hypothetical protein